MSADLSISLIRESGKYFDLLAAITGTIFFYKYKHTYLRYFLYLLWYITFSEFFADYIHENKIKSLLYFNPLNNLYYNHWVYNAIDTVSFIVYYFIYYNAISGKRFKNWIKIFAFSYIALSLVNWVFVQNFLGEIQSYLFIIGAIFLIISIIFYFVELLRSDKVLIFHKNLLFWVSVGLLLYYSGNIPFAAEFNGYALIPGIHKLFLIVNILAILMYLIFIFGFIWSKKESH